MNIRCLITALCLVAYLALLSACDNDSSRSHGEENGDGGPIGTGQALLGPIVHAEATISLLDKQNQTICATTTVDSNDLEIAGTVLFENNCFDDDETLYLITVTGGEDIDVDDDGILDATPTELVQPIHVIITGAKIAAGGWKVSAATEAAYKALIPLFLDGSRTISSAEENEIAKQLIREDIDGDGEITMDDLYAWNPRLHADRLTPAGEVVVDMFIRDAYRSGGGGVAGGVACSEPVSVDISSEASSECIDRYSDSSSYEYSTSPDAHIVALLSTDTNFSQSDLMVVGSTAYLPVYQQGAWSFDISNVGAIGWLFDSLEYRREIVLDTWIIVDQLLYAIEELDEGQYRLQLLDVTDPAAPVRKGSVTLENNGLLYTFNGHEILKASDGNSSLYRINAINANNPKLEKIFSTPAESIHLNDFVFTDQYITLAYLNPSDDSEPIAESCDLKVTTIWLDKDARLSEDLTENLAINVNCDKHSGISALQEFEFSSVYPIPQATSTTASLGRSIDGVSISEQRSTLYDISDPLSPALLAELKGQINSVSDDYVYTIETLIDPGKNNPQYFSVIRVYDRLSLELAGAITLERNYNLGKIVVHGDYAFVISLDSGLMVLDFSELHNGASP